MQKHWPKWKISLINDFKSGSSIGWLQFRYWMKLKSAVHTDRSEQVETIIRNYMNEFPEGKK